MTRTITDDRCEHLCGTCGEPWECGRVPSDCREMTRFSICEDCLEAEAIALTLLQPMDAGLPT